MFSNCFIIITVFVFYVFFSLQYRSNFCKYNKLLVSGASQNHGNLLILMIYRVIKFNKNICLVLWDLGLNTAQKSDIFQLIRMIKSRKKIYIDIYYHKFNYKYYPPYFNINVKSGNYAWKPIIIYSTYNIYKKTLLWLDAGCYVNGSLDSLYEKIELMKIWSISAGHSIEQFTYKSILKLFNVSDLVKNKSMCAAGVLGFSYPSAFSKKILELWKICALKLNCIAPYGSNRKNHRQDQSALSIILYQNKYKYNCKQYSNLNISVHYDKKIKHIKSKEYYREYIFHLL